MAGLLDLGFAVGCIGAPFGVAKLIGRVLVLVSSFDVKNETVSWHLVIFLNLNDVANVKIFPWSAHEALVTSVEHKLLTLELVDTVGRMLHLGVLEDVDGCLAHNVDHCDTVDDDPPFIVSTG